MEESTKNKLCDYGCGKPAKYYFKIVKKWCCSKHQNSCPSTRKGYPKGRKNPKLSLIMKGKTPWNKGIKGYCIHDEDFKKRAAENCKNRITSKETREKIRNSKLGKKQKSPSLETRLKMSINNASKRLEVKEKISKASKNCWKSEEYRNKILNTFTKERRENLRNRMINGGHHHATKFIKKISNEEVKLRDMVKELYPDCEFQYPLLNYDLDVALPKYKLAIEFDGYYHFHTEKSKEYFKIRREKIENEGWCLISYTMYEKLPDLEKLQNDIFNVIHKD